MDGDPETPATLVGLSPTIGSVPAGIARPLWSVMIPTYNCARYLLRALESVLCQDPGLEHMQIEVVDDCSTEDDPEAVVREIGRGRVLFHRNEKNLRLAGNFNVCIQRSRGHLVHILNGDDYVGPEFYNKVARAFQRSGECAAVFSRSFIVDRDEDILGVSIFCSSLKIPSKDSRELFANNPIRTPGVVVRRSFYERYGGFDARLVHILDWEMWVRAIVYGSAQMLDEPLAYYRVHDQSETSIRTRSAENLEDHLRLSAKWRAEGLKGFNHAAFERRVVRLAFLQAVEFAVRGDREAAALNYRLWHEHATPLQYPLAFLAVLLGVGRRTARCLRRVVFPRGRPIRVRSRIGPTPHGG